MANTFLDEKISSFIEDRFPEFVRTHHPVFVDFLRLYYQFMESAKITLSSAQIQDRVLLENLLTTNYLILEDGSRVYTEDSLFGAFEKGETITGQTSGATSIILAEDNNNSILYVEQNRHLQVGEVIVGSSSKASGIIGKYQGNPVQTIQQLLEYANIDRTITDFLDQFRDAYLTAIPNTLADGVSKRNLVKNIRDMYRAKGTRKGHELFFRLLFAETPEIFYPTDNLLKVSAGDWTSDTVVRITADEGDPNNLVGQTITQSVNVVLGATVASASVESVVQMQEGENTVYQLILNLDSILGTFVSGATIQGIDSTDADQSVTGTVQTILTGASVTKGGSLYTTEDSVLVTSATGQQAQIDIVDVGAGEIDEIIIDNPGQNYEVGQDIYFNNANTEGSGASAKITCIGGAIGPEAGDIAEYGMGPLEHIVYEDATEQTDAYTGNQIQFEYDTFADLGDQHSGSGIDSISRSSTTATVTTTNPHGLISGRQIIIAGATPSAYNGEKIITVTGTTTFTYSIAGSPSTPAGGTKTFSTPGGRAHFTAHGYEGSQIDDEAKEVVNITMFSGGSGYEKLPQILPSSSRLYWNRFDISTTGTFVAGEVVTNASNVSGTIAVLRVGNMTLASATGAFSQGDVITGGTSGAKATLTSVSVHGTGATFKAWSDTGVGSVKGVDIVKFGTGFATAPTLSLPIKFLITRNINVGSPPDVTTATAFAVGDTLRGQTSNATGTVTAWNNETQTLTVSITSQNFTTGEVLKRGDVTNYAILSKQSQAELAATIGTVGTTAGAYDNDKGKVSESLMKIQDSYYYQDFSYVVRVGAAIADWRGAVKKAVHPAGFAVFGEVSVTSQVSAKIKTPIEILGVPVATETPTLGSLFEAVLTIKVARRLGTADDGTTKRANAHYGHHTGQLAEIKSITRSVTTATLTTNTPHRLVVGQEIEISGVVTTGYGGGEITIASVPTDSTFTYTVANNLATPAVLTANAKVFYPTPFDRNTRDLTMSSHYDIPVQVQILSGFDILQRNRYGLGASKRIASRYMWSMNATSDSSPVKQTNIEYAYPGITRRQMPETGTDNVGAGGAGVYDSTMNYTNIQIGVHEQNVHMTLEQFGGVRIDEIARPERIIAESGTLDMLNSEDDRSYFLSEDDSSTYIESLDGVTTTNDSQTIPNEAYKLWNVPPPSYIRGINVSTGEYVSFDDNTSPPDFSDNTAPPSFDATSGT